jgi:hypothetical protein
MGILKKKDDAVAAQAPAFEAQDDTVVLEREDTVAQEAGNTPAATPAAKPRVQRPVEAAAEPQAEVVKEDAAKPEAVKPAPQEAQPAASASRSVSLIKRDENGQPITLLSGKGESTNLLANLKGAFAIAGHSVSYSTFPRLKLDTGKIATKEGDEAGDWIELQVISYDPSWTVGTGDDSEASKVHVRFSDDGLAVQGAGDDDEFAGMTLTEYRDVLREKGFEKAAVKEYTLVTGIAVMQQNDDFVHANEIVVLSLSPTSKGKFDSYVISRGLQARMGKVKEESANPIVRFTSNRVKGKDRSYFTLVPSHGSAKPVEL